MDEYLFAKYTMYGTHIVVVAAESEEQAKKFLGSGSQFYALQRTFVIDVNYEELKPGIVWEHEYDDPSYDG